MEVRVLGFVVLVVVFVGLGVGAAVDDSPIAEATETDPRVPAAEAGIPQVTTTTAPSTQTPTETPESETPTPTPTPSEAPGTPTPNPTETPATPTPTPTPTPSETPGTPTPTPTETPATATPAPPETDSSPGEPVVEAGMGYPQSSTDSEIVEYQSGYQCLENPWRLDDEDDYTYDDYGMWIPDRFVEDLLDTDGVRRVSSGIEGEQVDAGALVFVTTQSGTEPMVYCDADDSESVIIPDYHWNGTYTPTSSLAWANPTYDSQMLISDQAVEWLLSKDRVVTVEASRIESNQGTETRITVVVNDGHPAPDRRDSLPDAIDGYDVTYTADSN